MSKVKIRIATVDDAADLVNIYSYYVKNTAITCETKVPSVEEFKARIQNTLQKYPYLVAILNDEIVGYAYLSNFKERTAYRFDAETSIYLSSETRGHHIGTQIYDLLEKIAQKMGIVNLMSCITYPHGEEDEHLTLTSPKFHEHLGYHLVGRFDRCTYKFNKWYDMIWMQKVIGNHDIQKNDIIPFYKVREDFNL